MNRTAKIAIKYLNIFVILVCLVLVFDAKNHRGGENFAALFLFPIVILAVLVNLALTYGLECSSDKNLCLFYYSIYVAILGYHLAF